MCRDISWVQVVEERSEYAALWDAGHFQFSGRRLSMLKDLRQWFGKSTTSLFRAVASKVQNALMIAKLR